MAETDTTVDGFNTKLSFTDPVGGSSSDITGLTDLTPPTPQYDDVERSTYVSPGKAKQFKSGWVDYGTVTGTCQYSPDQYATLMGICGKTVSWTVTLADGATVGFDGYLKELPLKPDREGIITIDLSIKVDGKATYSAGVGT